MNIVGDLEFVGFYGIGFVDHGRIFFYVGWEVFLLSSALALAITVLTISMQSVRAALGRPADSLQSE